MWRILLLVFGLGAAHACAQWPVIQGGNRYSRPGYANVHAFQAALEAKAPPWDQLLTYKPADGEEEQESIQDHGPFSRGFKVIRYAKTYAVAFFHSKPLRDSPMCAALFLLEKKPDGLFHVADLVFTGAEPSFSDISDPEILALAPRGLLHVHFNLSLGGRRERETYDEFFIVDHHRFHETLKVHDGTFDINPRFERAQDATVSAFRGRLAITAHYRLSFGDGREESREATAHFHWDPTTRAFASRNLNRIVVGK